MLSLGQLVGQLLLQRELSMKEWVAEMVVAEMAQVVVATASVMAVAGRLEFGDRGGLLMLIRAALMDEIEAIIELGKRGHVASENAQYEFDEGKTKLLLATLIAGKRTCVFVAVEGDKIVGLLLGQEDSYPYCKMRYATDISLYAEVPGSGRKLLKKFEEWAFEERKVDQLIMGVSYGGKSVKSASSLYSKLGFEPVGGIYTKQRKSL